jgi:hypothetical protein
MLLSNLKSAIHTSTYANIRPDKGPLDFVLPLLPSPSLIAALLFFFLACSTFSSDDRSLSIVCLAPLFMLCCFSGLVGWVTFPSFSGAFYLFLSDGGGVSRDQSSGSGVWVMFPSSFLIFICSAVTPMPILVCFVFAFSS